MNSDSDLQIAGDILEVPHLLQAPREHPATVAEFVGLARSVAADRARWEHLVRYDATSRWYHLLHTGPGYEVWLLSWVPGQGSGPHDHGRSSGVLTVLDGELTERTERGERVLGAGAQKVFAPGYVHEVVNDALEPAVSLHVYFPGLTEMPMHPQTPAHTAGATGAAGLACAAPATLGPADAFSA
ncbi:cysteine dioxygenase family protein [Streptomyces sp. IBSBF 2953]|uniref:cysteine dioxygenase n=1 Tax=Streptomyces TaxID=1883 RepID=UPI002119D696|nr:cysteine dioxygenase family protein [Streptomyces scabiei]MCQ9184548.1 cysteine dioxygenase family protein [Streptomyces hayashii]MDX3117451.1 cysteine dioxygenase family protein [Streptomyces scabiei]